MKKIMMFEEYKAYKRKQNIKRTIYFILAIFFVWLIFIFKTPYTIVTMGGTDDVRQRIVVEGGFRSRGSFNIVYVNVQDGTVYNLVKTMFQRRELINTSNGTVDDRVEYIYTDSSYQNAIVNLLVLLEEEGMEIDYDEFVTYLFDDVSCDLRIGDEILKYDGNRLNEPQPFIDYIQSFELPAKVTLELRGTDRETRTVTCDLQKLGSRNVIGYGYIGVNRLMSEHAVVERIGTYLNMYSGPSSGFVITLELYNQLTMKDLTKGYDVVATGTIEYDGSIGQIGFVEMKLLAAEESGADYLFVADNDNEGSNYKIALQMKEEMDLDIEVVKINHINEAISFLKGLE